MNTAQTLDTQLNVFATFEPTFRKFKSADLLFLANIQPTLQLGVREQCKNADFRRNGHDELLDSRP
jgi:hypothetical protein